MEVLHFDQEWRELYLPTWARDCTDEYLRFSKDAAAATKHIWQRKVSTVVSSQAASLEMMLALKALSEQSRFRTCLCDLLRTCLDLWC